MICYLIRHGKDDDSLRGGWSDSPLTKEGVLEVEALADRLSADVQMNIARIFSSDLKRAEQTAEIISSRLGIEVEYLPQFRETNNGALAGMKNDVAAVKYPGLYWSTLEWDECYPAGESPHQFFDRICAAWSAFKQDVKALKGNAVLVTHGGVINVISHIEGGTRYTNKEKPFAVRNAEIVAFEL